MAVLEYSGEALYVEAFDVCASVRVNSADVRKVGVFSQRHGKCMHVVRVLSVQKLFHRLLDSRSIFCALKHSFPLSHSEAPKNKQRAITENDACGIDMVAPPVRGPGVHAAPATPVAQRMKISTQEKHPRVQGSADQQNQRDAQNQNQERNGGSHRGERLREQRFTTKSTDKRHAGHEEKTPKLGRPVRVPSSSCGEAP